MDDNYITSCATKFLFLNAGLLKILFFHLSARHMNHMTHSLTFILWPNRNPFSGSDCSLSMTLMQLFLNMVFHFYTFCCSKTLFPYCSESLRWISASGTLSAHINLIIAHCNLLVKVENISQSCRAFVLFPVHNMSSATKTARFKINHCWNFLTHHCMYGIAPIDTYDRMIFGFKSCLS